MMPTGTDPYADVPLLDCEPPDYGAEPAPVIRIDRGRRLMLPPPETPMPVARELIKLLWTDGQGRETLVRWRGAWLEYRRGAYAEVDAESIRSAVYAQLEHARFQPPPAKDGSRPEPKSWTPNDSRVSRVVDALRAITLLDSETEPDTWVRGATGPASVYPCTNVLLDLAGQRPIPHDPRYFTLRMPTIEFDPDAQAPEFLRFIDGVWGDDPQARSLALRWLGYVISGRIDAQKALLIVGPSRAGKGTFMMIAAWLIGVTLTASPKLHELGGRFGLESLIGKRLVTIGDVRMDGSESSTRLVEALLGLIAGDRTNVQRKGRIDWIGRLMLVLMAGTNVLPRLNDASPAVTDRWVILPVKRGHATAPDRGLASRMEREKSGILNIALGAAAGLPPVDSDERIFVESESAKPHRESLRRLSSPVAAFVNDACHVGPEALVAKGKLYAAYKAWCETTGHKAKSLETLSADLYALELSGLPAGITDERRRVNGERVRAFGGICLPGTQNDLIE